MKWEPVKQGPKGIVEKLNLLGELVTRATPLEGRGMRITGTKEGTILDRVADVGGFKKAPWTLETYLDEVGTKLRVHYGQVHRTTILDDSTGANILAFAEVNVEVNGGDLVNDPATPIGAVGAIALTSSTTYGVWLKVLVRKSGWSYYDAPGEETIDATVVDMATSGAASVVADSTNTDASDAATITGSTSGYAYLYLGKVTVDGDGKGTVRQFRNSDIILPASLYVGHVLSTDNSNDNAITLGTDQGLYLAPDTFVVSITGGTDISITDDGGGSFTIDYTG